MGHYIAYTRAQDGSWTKFDDAAVNVADDLDSDDPGFQKNVYVILLEV